MKSRSCKRDDGSWLIDGVTPITDVLRALQLDALPHGDEYETLAGFLMVMLRRVPQADRQRCVGRLPLRGAGRGQLPDRPGDGHNPALLTGAAASR
jgi:hypothetical protein